MPHCSELMPSATLSLVVKCYIVKYKQTHFQVKKYFNAAGLVVHVDIMEMFSDGFVIFPKEMNPSLFDKIEKCCQ